MRDFISLLWPEEEILLCFFRLLENSEIFEFSEFFRELRVVGFERGAQKAKKSSRWKDSCQNLGKQDCRVGEVKNPVTLY